VDSMVQRKEKEEESRYIQEASAPAATPCIRPVTCLRHNYTCNNRIPTSTIRMPTRLDAGIRAFTSNASQTEV